MSDPSRLILEIGDTPAKRLDKALTAAVPEGVTLSRSRIQSLIENGAVKLDGAAITNPKAKVSAGQQYEILVPNAEDIEARPEDIALDVIFEDDDLIVVNKPVGMVVHPAPGSETGTLVNALLHHCADSLSGIGGAKRPGIVHRIDKDTSGLLVVAKTDTAHQGLAAQFAEHTLERKYEALVWGAPSAADPRLAGISGVAFEPGGIIRVSGNIERHKTDRKRMRVVTNSGRHAITRAQVLESFGPIEKPVVSRIQCQLETGRTHQIRVHMTHIGHSLIGDQTYGSKRAIPKKALPIACAEMLRQFPRQALHAATLGFIHPVNGEAMSFTAAPPSDMTDLITLLRAQ